MFRDQSHETVVRVTGEAATPAKGRHKSAQSETSIREDREQVGKARPASCVLLQSPGLDKDRGLIDFFANNFIDGDSIGMRNNLFWVPSNFNETLKTDCVRLSVQSVGAMALTRLRHSPEHIAEAHERYSMALLSLAAVWRQGIELKRDTFSLAAIFLGFFEILASYDKRSHLSWRTHLSGLASLFETCDTEYLQTDFGARMFRQTRSQVLMDSLQSRTPLPEAFAGLIFGDQPDFQSQFKHFDGADRLLARVANLQAQHRFMGASQTILCELLDVNAACRSWMEGLPPPFLFSKQPTKYPYESWWDAREDVYSSGFVAHTWCKVRAAMIIVYDLVQETLELLPAGQVESNIQLVSTSSQPLTSETVRQLATDICATIPAYYRRCTATMDPSARPPPPALGTTFWLLWVLEVVGLMREAPPELTTWIVQSLKWAYQATGIVKMQLVAQRLDTGYRGPVLP